MLTIEIIGVFILLVGLLIYAMVRTQLERRRSSLVAKAGQGARIMIVDDDPDFVKIATRILESHGYDISTASSGASALKALYFKRRNKPDLLLLDIMMDYVTDGLDVRKIMQNDPDLADIPVIMVTSLTGVRRQEIFPSDEHMAVDAWLSKPVKAEVLLRTVQDALAGVPAGVPVRVPAVS